jgi:hypothetical protein
MKVAWHAVPGKGERATSVPEGRLMSPLVPKIFCIEVYAMRFEKRQILLLKSPSAMPRIYTTHMYVVIDNSQEDKMS